MLLGYVGTFIRACNCFYETPQYTLSNQACFWIHKEMLGDPWVAEQTQGAIGYTITHMGLQQNVPKALVHFVFQLLRHPLCLRTTESLSSGANMRPWGNWCLVQRTQVLVWILTVSAVPREWLSDTGKTLLASINTRYFAVAQEKTPKK